MNDKQIEFFELVRDYLTRYLPRVRKLSPHTVRSYKTAIKLLINFFEKKKAVSLKEMSVGLINPDSLNEFIIWLREMDIKASTINLRIAAVRAFFNFVCMKEPLYVGLSERIKTIKKLKVGEKPITYLSTGETAALLNAPGTENKGERDRLLLLLLYETACREAEIAAIKYEDFFIRDNKIALLVNGKGGKQRFIPVPDNVYEKVMKFRARQQRTTRYVFSSPSRAHEAHITTSSVYKIVAKYGQKINLPYDLHPHTLRHTRAMHWYQGGVSLEIISLLLGHSQLETTRIYARADIEMKRKALEKIEPLQQSGNNHELFDWEDKSLIMRLAGLT